MPEKQADIHMYGDLADAPPEIKTLAAHAAAGLGANINPPGVRNISAWCRVQSQLINAQQGVIEAQSEALVKAVSRYQSVVRREKRVLIALIVFMLVWWTLEFARWLL